MMGIGFAEFLVIGVVALVVFGPDRLPEFARQAGRMVRQVRQMSRQARDDIRTELGPEYADFELTDLDPRRAIRKHLQEAWDERGRRRSGHRPRRPAAATRRDPAVRQRRDLTARRSSLVGLSRPCASSVTSTVCCSPSRTTVELDRLARPVAADRDDERDAVGDARLARPRRSGHPARRPASDAGVPEGTSATVAPLVLVPPVLTLAPMTGYSALPVSRICPAVIRTCSIGIAKPTPMLPASPPIPPPVVAIAEFTPTTWPRRLTSGPPELPGLIAASVCTALM